MGAEPPALENFVFFWQNNLILAYFDKINAIKTWHRKLAVQKHNYTTCINGLCGRKLLLEFQFSYFQAGKS